MLQTLGVSEGPLDVSGDRGASADVGPGAGASDVERRGGASSDLDPHEVVSSDIGSREVPGDAVTLVAEQAAGIARERGAGDVATTDLLLAVMEVYGTDFDRVLRAHGTDRDDLIERLAAG